MKEIRLSKGLVTIVDDEDYEELSQFAWHALGTSGKHYAARTFRRSDGTVGCELLSRRLMGLGPGREPQVDHINRVRLDNRKANLRVVTSRQNNENRKDQSPYGVGVYFRPAQTKNPYAAYIQVGPTQLCLGSFATPHEARVARIEWLTGGP